MPHTLHHPSAPPARLTDAVAALQLVDLAISRPLRPETVVFLADDAHLGHTCFIVSGTSGVDDVLDVAALVVEVAERSPAVHAVVLATVRPAEPHRPSERSDLDRGLELLELFEAAGLELLDWFVIGPDGASSLREGTGLPPAVAGRRRTAAQPAARARRSAGDSRRPAARSRRSSSRLGTGMAPAASISGRCSSGMS